MIEVLYAVDHFANSSGDVGVGTRFRRRGQFNPHALGRRTGGIDRQPDSGTQSHLNGAAQQTSVGVGKRFGRHVALRRPAFVTDDLFQEPFEGDSIMGGKADEVKGRLKEAAGALTGDDQLRAEGKTDQALGQVQ